MTKDTRVKEPLRELDEKELEEVISHCILFDFENTKDIRKLIDNLVNSIYEDFGTKEPIVFVDYNEYHNKRVEPEIDAEKLAEIMKRLDNMWSRKTDEKPPYYKYITEQLIKNRKEWLK